MIKKLQRPVLLPVYQCNIHVWATEPTGPRDLDKIFFELLQIGVTTRGQMADCLGVDDDSFVFTHLDILVRDGYVSEKENLYALTDHGNQFIDGKFMEDSFSPEEFSFFWDVMKHSAVEKPRNSNNQGKKIEDKAVLDDRELLSILPQIFNKKNRAKSLEFYSINESERGGKIYHKKMWAEYIAIFEQSKSTMDDGWQVELREIDAKGRKILCRDLTEIANDRTKQWWQHFETYFQELKAAK